ncbi:Lipocalin-like domain-containing protein [Aquimarina amphilecti]|uniref:Lipocalin-like domain-containing protein n=1 Tax=Aquimarina amphilecti TaxID=1038014 RepID=A0A1H7SAF5_AQUAM|nr:lipocalin family protein [Aquimarina amphilecti]SEL69612.1 Lipocalin-like domain-containing protein [Aquimarina amphilecti]
MKKIILLFTTISTLLVSCKSDDDATGSVDIQDPFVGTWRITQEFENGAEVMQEACDFAETIIVMDDMTFSGIYYMMGASSCEVGGTYAGTWENLGNNKYKVTSDDPEATQVEATVTFLGDTMTIVTNDEDGEFKQILTRQ